MAHMRNAHGRSIPRFTVADVVLGGLLVFLVLSAFFSTFLSASQRIREHLRSQGIPVHADAAGLAASLARSGPGATPPPLPQLANPLGQAAPFTLELLGVGLALFLVYLYHRPLVRCFGLKRRGQAVPEPLLALSRKRLSRSPLALGLALPLAMAAVELLMIGFLSAFMADSGLAREQLALLGPKSLLLALAGLFMFLWQKHRVQNVYLRHLYSAEELASRLPRGPRGSIRHTVVIISFLTVVLPSAVTFSLLFSGVTAVQSAQSLSSEQMALLFGHDPAPQGGSSSAPGGQASGAPSSGGSPLSWEGILRSLDAAGLPHLPLLYFTVLDSWRLIIGMCIGTLIMLVYVFFVVRWVSADFILPLEELRTNIRALSEEDRRELTPVVSNNEVGELALGFNGMLEGLEERNRIKGLFGQYLTREVSEAILDGKLNLGGDLYRATVVFTDIRNFTAMSERMSPEEVFRFLNEYLDAMIDTILSNGGFIDKFIGDGILSVFGLPVRDEGHAEAAVRTALAMEAKLASLNADRAGRGLEPIAIGSGIHTGAVIAGNVGNDKRVQFTVIGDTVNLAARLEDLTKAYSSSIVLSDATWEALPEELRSGGRFERLSGVEVRGKSEPLTLYKAS